MMHSNKTQGFTLIETLLALVVMGLMFAPLFVTQGSILQGVGRNSRLYERIVAAKNFLVQSNFALAHGAKQRTLEKRIENPDARLVYTRSELSSDSRVGDRFQHIVVDRVAITWDDAGTSRSDALVMFVYNPETKESS